MTLPAAPLSYTADLLSYHRRKTREVMVGDVGVGGDNPIRVQSMTTTLTKDVQATANQAERLVAAGCEIVRITTPTPDDARCLKQIREILDSRGVRVPLVADIHFSPLAAMVAADFADKVRVNPGNYVDSRRFAVREYSDAQYSEEVERVVERVTPLVLKCKERGVSMRIGTNHGSLSDRIMNRFGDTPEGMVESALEFVRVCEANGYYDVILSMKASNPKVMIAAYRLLAARMAGLGMEYPFHLGVTEAGNDEDGRIKSAIGIGSLLEDGIGDTIRVSLTEEPEAEIPVAQAIAARYPKSQGSTSPGDAEAAWDPYHYQRRESDAIRVGDIAFGGTETVSVAVGIDGPLSRTSHMPALLRWASPAGRRRPKPEIARVEVASHDDLDSLRKARQTLGSLPLARLLLLVSGQDPRILAEAASDADMVGLRILAAAPVPEELRLLGQELSGRGVPVVVVGVVREIGSIEATVATVLETAHILCSAGAEVLLSLRVSDTAAVAAYRLLAIRAAQAGSRRPILLQADAGTDEAGLARLLGPSIVLGSLLCDGIGDAVGIHGAGDTVSLAFNILQASGARISKTDYVACPSCGRTLFDLQETTDRIKSRTSHLVGVKLAIMGCIVNGPGEMADADFGYVGGAPGKVNLYVGKECVEKGVPAVEADDRLIALIKSHGKWHEEEPELEAEQDAGKAVAAV
jgi:(E)-4-hydroxy-3-methylbut-2-enyl-diphosphate synthase